MTGSRFCQKVSNFEVVVGAVTQDRFFRNTSSHEMREREM